MKPLPRGFYSRDTLTVAKDLLGKCLVRHLSAGNIEAMIVEVEAYRGSDDPASHAYKGSTPRNQVMFGKPGFSYVYFTYGKHYCLNVTTEREGVPGAVLVRAIEIIGGVELAFKNRKANSLVNLSNGPGKLTEALNITKIHNELDLTKGGELIIRHPDINKSHTITASRRIGIKAGNKRFWRFHIKNNRFVSRL
ncbi:MAG: DNA-3-methyladenine glycosylase [Candidatus Bathyarchaeota archaeon]|nr:DNA-3-methyladenine glycosylase [Candidatus Bathyarchaeota archaeon]